MKHLLVDISAHGYGHIAQTAPVLNLLAQQLPGLRITVRSHVSSEYLRQRIQAPFEHIQVALDFGMVMQDAIRVDVQSSLVAYREYHRDWQEKVEGAAEQMSTLRPDLLLANVPYLSLAAAQAAGITSIAMCCLNWADIYHHYAQDDDEASAIHRQMLTSYSSAKEFLKLSPSMPMDDLTNTRELACVAQLGTPHRRLIRELCGVDEQERLVVVAMGGIDYRLPMESWPVISGRHWLVPGSWGLQRGDVTPIESLGMDFRDILASCDAILTKPGYGTFAEAACAGIPVLYVPRSDWPEVPWLVEWLHLNGVALQVESENLHTGVLDEHLEKLWSMTPPAQPSSTGVVEVVQTVCKMLS